MSPSQDGPGRPPASDTGVGDVEALPAAPVGARLKTLLVTVGLIVVTLVVGWLAWSVVEWGSGRTPSYRLANLRVVRRSDRTPIGFGRSVLREVCCAVLLIPTMLAGCLLALGFAMGASPPDGVLGQSRRSPWDVLTGTEVVSEAPRKATTQI